MMVLPAGMFEAMPCLVKLQPMPSTTSARDRKWYDGPGMTPPPAVPSASGWSSGNALLPSSVVMTGIWSSSASSSSSGQASAYITPCPAWITGAFACSSTRVAASMSRALPAGLVAFTGRYWSAISAPGPYCIANTPSRRPFVVRLKPSAMPTPTRSWRQSTGRIPAAAAASITGVVGYVLRNSTPSRFMISASASTTFISGSFWRRGSAPSRLPCEHAGCRLRSEPHGLTAELFGDEVPAERRVVRRAVSVAVAALDRLRVEDGTGAAALEQAVDGADTLPRDVGLVAPVAGAIELGEALRACRSVEDLADVLAVERARRVDLGAGLGQPELQGHRIRGAAGPRHALSARHELVDRALGDTDEGRGQVPSGQTPERRAVAQASVQFPAGHVLDAAPFGIDDPVRGHKGVLDHDVLAAAPAHARGEPRVDDLVVRARE